MDRYDGGFLRDEDGALVVVGPNGSAVGAHEGTRMYRNTVGGPHLLVTSGAISLIPLTDVEFNDDDDTYALSGGKVLVKRAGLYDLAYSMNFVGGTSGARNVQVTKNGDTADDMIREAGAVGTDARPGGAGAIRLAANDLLGLTCFVSGGTDVTAEANYVKDIGIDLIRMGD